MKDSTERLIRQYANATKTYYGARDQEKAKANKAEADRLKGKLIGMGVKVPSLDEVKHIGIFNGHGSV